MSGSRPIDYNKQFDLADFTQCVLSISTLAIKTKDSILASHIEKILKFIEYVAAEDDAKVKILRPQLLKIFKDILEHPGFKPKHYASLTLIIDDFKQGCKRLMQLLRPVADRYFSGLKLQIEKSTPKNFAPIFIKSGGSLALALDINENLKLCLLLDEEKGKLSALMRQSESQQTTQDKNLYKTSLCAYLDKTFSQIRLLNNLDSDVRYERLIVLHKDVWQMIVKLKDVEPDACRNYILHACRTYNHLLDELMNLNHLGYDLYDIEHLLATAINAIFQMEKFDAVELYEMSILKFKLAGVTMMLDQIDRAAQFCQHTSAHLLQCIRLAESAEIPESNIIYKEFIRTAKLGLLANNLNLMRIKVGQDATANTTWLLMLNVCYTAQQFFGSLYADWKKMKTSEASAVSLEQQENFQMADIEATLESMLEIYIELIDVLLDMYIPVTMNVTTGNGIHFENVSLCGAEVDCLETFWKQLYSQNMNNNSASTSKHISALKLKFMEKKFEHVEALIAAKSSETTSILTNLGTAMVILTNLIKDVELSAHAHLKERKQTLLAKITALKAEALKNLSNRPQTVRRVPASLSFLNSMPAMQSSSTLGLDSGLASSTRQNAPSQSSAETPETKQNTRQQPRKH